jgi:hypothetical protein
MSGFNYPNDSRNLSFLLPHQSLPRQGTAQDSHLFPNPAWPSQVWAARNPLEPGQLEIGMPVEILA